jgi:uncharacterized protein YjbI with pentapeptide repeats
VSGRPRKELIAVSRVQLAEALHKHAWFRESRPRGQRAVLMDCDLDGISLAGLDLSQTDLTGSSCRGASLVGCQFDMATAFCCDFTQANLENASFKRADLRGSRFAGALKFVLARGIGQAFTATNVPEAAVTELLRDAGCTA